MLFALSGHADAAGDGGADPPAGGEHEARPRRHSKPPERFVHSQHAAWSAYDLSRRDGRHGPAAHARVAAACEEEPALAAELDAIFKRLKAVVAAPTVMPSTGAIHDVAARC